MGKMKKFILAVATGVCAISAHAEDPKQIDFNVQLKGEVPTQHFFEVTSIDWNSGDEIKMNIPEGWNGKPEIHGAATLKWNVRSSYGPVRMTLNVNHQSGNSKYGSMPNITDEKKNGIIYRAKIGDEYITPSVPLNVATAQEASGTKEVVAKINLHTFKDVSATPGHIYASGATVVFETGFEE